MFLPESPRWDYRRGKVDKARKCVAAAYGVPVNHREVAREMREIKEKFDAESAPGVEHPWYEVLTGPRMTYRTLLGISLQILQQLTGSYETSMIDMNFALMSYFQAPITSSTTEPPFSSLLASATPTLPLSFSARSTLAAHSEVFTSLSTLVVDCRLWLDQPAWSSASSSLPRLDTQS